MPGYSSIWNTSFNADQEAFLTVATPGELDLYARYDTATDTGYMMEYEHDTLNANLYKVTGLGGFTLIGSGSTGRPLTGYKPAFIAPTSPASTINVLTQYGTSDANVRAALTAAASSGSKLYFPAATYTLNSRLINNGLTMYGDGDTTIFSMTDRTSSAIILQGTGPRLLNCKITCPNYAGTRLSSGDTTGVLIDHANGFNVEYVTVDGVASAGILSYGGHGSSSVYATIKYCKVTNSLADGIHHTNQSNWIETAYNTVGTNVGDDLISVVSYQTDGGQTHDIWVHDNDVGPQTFGRGMTVVGGNNVQFLNNNINGTYGAGILIATESAFNTYSVSNVLIRGNYMRNVAQSIHDANIYISVDNTNTSVTNVTGGANNGTSAHQLVRIAVTGSGASQSGNTVTCTAGIDMADGPSTGDVIRLRCQGTTISTILNSTTTLASVTDATYNRSGKIGFGVYSGTAIDDFGGGSGGGAGSNDTTPPSLQPMTIIFDQLMVPYDELLDENSVPSVNDFVYKVNNVTVGVTSVSVLGSDVTLTVPPVLSNQTCTLAYTPGTNKIRDLAGNNASSFAATSVTNSTTSQPIRVYVARTNVPRVLGTKIDSGGGGV